MTRFDGSVIFVCVVSIYAARNVLGIWNVFFKAWNTHWEHGWPWVYLRRQGDDRASIDRVAYSMFPVDGAPIMHFDSWNLLLDILTVVGLLLPIAVVCFWVRPKWSMTISLRSLFILIALLALVLEAIKRTNIPGILILDGMLQLIPGLATVWILIELLRRWIATGRAKPRS